MSISRNFMTSCALAAAMLGGSAAITSASATPTYYSYGSVKYLTNTPVYTLPSHNGQSGNVTFFGAPPTTLPSHNGQYGTVTFLNGAKPSTYPGHSGQSGNVTFINSQPKGTVPLSTVPAPHIAKVPTVPAPQIAKVPTVQVSHIVRVPTINVPVVRIR